MDGGTALAEGTKIKKGEGDFFTIGREDESSQSLYRRIVKEGHTLGMHLVSDNVTKKDMVRSVMAGVAKYDTSKVLLYDSADKKMTADSLSAIIDSLQAAGYELLPMDRSTVPIHH